MAKRTKRSKKSVQPSQLGNTQLAIVRFDSFPPDTYFVLTTRSANAKLAAERKQKTLNIPGGAVVALSYPVHSGVASQIEQKVREGLPQFPFGKEVLVKASLNDINDIVLSVFSEEPRQTALRFRLLEEELTTLEAHKQELSTSVEALSRELRQAQSKIQSLDAENRRLQERFEDVRDGLDRANERLSEYERRDEDGY